MLVYKYMPSDRFFGNFKFRLTPAEDLNDPRELVPDIRLRDPSAYARNIVLRNTESAYWRLQISRPDLSPEQVWAQITAAAAKHMENFDETAKKQDLFDMFMRVTNRNVGVLSLAEEPLNELMWAHYANSHAGFVVGLDGDSEFFSPKPGEPKVCGELMNVIYTDTNPVVYVEAGKIDIPKEVFFTKSPVWSYEKEWRMIKYLPSADEVQNVNDKPIHLFNVPADAIREVLIGAKTSVAKRGEVIAKVRATAPHASIKQVRFHPQTNFTTEDL
jgi:hypothetical protein